MYTYKHTHIDSVKKKNILQKYFLPSPHPSPLHVEHWKGKSALFLFSSLYCALLTPEDYTNIYCTYMESQQRTIVALSNIMNEII